MGTVRLSRLALAAMVACLLCLGADAGASVRRVRAISYNVWGLPQPLTTDPSRLEDIARILPRLGADIVAFQETFTRRARVLARTREYRYVAWGNPAKGLRFSSGLLLLSKHPIVETRNILFEDCRGFDCWARKGAQFARIRIPGVGDIAVYNTHLNAAGSESVRVHQVAQIADLIRRTSRGLPVILLGDMNYDPRSEADRALRSWSDLTDSHAAFARANPRLRRLDRDGFSYDYRRNRHLDSDGRPRRLDFAYLRDEIGRRMTIVRSALTFDAPVAGRFLSDHFGVRTDLVIQTR